MRVVIHVLYAYCQSYYGFQSGQLTKHGTTGHHSSHSTNAALLFTALVTLIGSELVKDDEC